VLSLSSLLSYPRNNEYSYAFQNRRRHPADDGVVLGGYLRWFEPLACQSASKNPFPTCQLLLSTSTANCGRSQSHIPLTGKYPHHFSRHHAAFLDQARWVKQLPELSQSHGLEAVTTDRHLCGDQYCRDVGSEQSRWLSGVG